ncbi:MAG: polysaccharide deacetylase family protein [Betaproteobacteria bacterium]|nr:polysaccharide deacetylase family protein [Betaproteobacteria bacterium]
MAARAAAILMYHGLRQGAPRGPRRDPGVERYVVSREDFERQMRWLREGGWASVGLGDFLSTGGARWPDRPAGITFDDGYASDRHVALPVLQALGLRAAFFIVTDWIGRPGFLSRGEIRELAAAGMEIGSHTASHRFLSELPDSQVREELATSRRTLEDLTGGPVRFLSLPGGRCSRATLHIAQEAGYDAVCTSWVGLNRPGGGVFCLRRIPVLGTTSLARFQHLVAGDPWVLGGSLALSALRRALRAAIGRRAYDGFRRWGLGTVRTCGSSNVRR